MYKFLSGRFYCKCYIFLRKNYGKLQIRLFHFSITFQPSRGTRKRVGSSGTNLYARIVDRRNTTDNEYNNMPIRMSTFCRQWRFRVLTHFRTTAPVRCVYYQNLSNRYRYMYIIIQQFEHVESSSLRRMLCSLWMGGGRDTGKVQKAERGWNV